MSCAVITGMVSPQYDGSTVTMTVQFVVGQETPSAESTSFEFLVMLDAGQSQSLNRAQIRDAVVAYALANGYAVDNVLFQDLTYLAG